MTHHARQILKEALTLPEEERIGLANDLLESVEGAGGPEWEAAWAAEIDARLERYRQGIDEPIPWAEVRERIEKRIGRR